MTILFAKYDSNVTYPGQKKFDCGHAIINKFVHDSLKSQVKKGVCVAYVLTDQSKAGQFVGFFTIGQHSISLSALSALSLGSLPKQIPCTRLIMLGVDSQYQGRDLGKQLMKEAFLATKLAAQAVGSFGMYLDADAGAVKFYTGLGFSLLEGDKSPDPSPMFLRMTSIP
ncbi:GNAT family N-acetyltransferase [Duganella qianjiadongensis]|uniref:GNAT family N-acetyltransferase n=1 Tax=Duganella qianjiadongensis TaxID=2692176 RepID=A0ABW9VKK0_9BURK|nr:GNAT family N-acetyltransferase [Duganella qianjiadongensis]MYM39175.1 GNAT family N-acetyltransferase [Duganella qianjiadongensis]